MASKHGPGARGCYRVGTGGHPIGRGVIHPMMIYEYRAFMFACAPDLQSFRNKFDDELERFTNANGAHWRVRTVNHVGATGLLFAVVMEREEPRDAE